MAKLPRSPLSEGVTNQYRPVREARASGADPVGQAMEQAGNAGLEIANRMADAKIATEAARADIGLRSDLDKLRRELDADAEIPPEQLENAYRERASKIVADRTSGMQSPALRRAFGTQSATALENGAIDMRDVTRRKQVAGARAEALTLFAEYEETAKNPTSFEKPKDGSPSTAEVARDNAISVADRYLASGVWDADTAAEMKLKAQATYDVGLTNAHITSISDKLENGDWQNANDYFIEYGSQIAKDKWPVIQTAIAEKKKEGVAISTADRLWDETGGNYGLAILETKKITNPEERTAAEARLGVLQNQFSAGKSAKQAADVESGMGYVVQGRSPPLSWFETADPDAVYTVQERLRARRAQASGLAGMTAAEKAAMKDQSARNKFILESQLTDKDLVQAGTVAILADPDLKDLYDNMLPDDQLAFDKKFAETKASPTPSGTIKAYSEVMSVMALSGVNFGKGKTFEDNFKAAGEGKPGDPYVSANRKKSKATLDLEGITMQLVTEELERTRGAPIDAARAKQIGALALAMAGEDKKTGETKYPIPQDLAIGIAETDARRAVIEFRKLKPKAWSKAAAAYPGESDAFILQKAKELSAGAALKRDINKLFGTSSEEIE
jgi:hypothetical protein